MTFTTEIHPGACARPSGASSGFVLNHTMLRIKDPDDYWIEIVEPGRLQALGLPAVAQATAP